ncbi:hypothetical protein [Azonexus hydrophilus]|uniref:Uncharacterized protein n=1 Tax=Azonexus hydrophilus TaxID=418702 RepID=A0ABZ2XN73_9RHOO
MNLSEPTLFAENEPGLPVLFAAEEIEVPEDILPAIKTDTSPRIYSYGVPLSVKHRQLATNGPKGAAGTHWTLPH